MLQPAYVFMIFVLKRNVFKIILGRDKKRPTITGKGKKITARDSRRSTVTTNIGYSESVAGNSGTNMEMQSMMKN
jgi:hypothetical protein